MGNVTTTKKKMNDALQFGAVKLTVSAGPEPLAQRTAVTSEFSVDTSIGEKFDTATFMLPDHPALTPAERTTFGALAKKIHDYCAANSEWLTG